jgi:hypothetical protein
MSGESSSSLVVFFILPKSRRVVVNNAPFVFEFAENEREFSLRIIRRSLQRPVSEHDGGIFRQNGYV